MADAAAFLAAIDEEHSLRTPLVHREWLPAGEASFAGGLPPGFEQLKPLLERRGIGALYTHQASALRHLESGHNVVLATPTASGKTLVYNLPVLRRTLEDERSRALYIFPLKALEQDQRQRLEEDIASLGMGGARIRVEIYDGDTPQSKRKKLRADPPAVLITTPDMLHAGILPHHASWRHFFSNLHMVAIDELHTYRGIFGSHVANVIRRLDRVARFHGAQPQFVAASATIANPGELATALTAKPFRVVQANGAPRAARQVLLFRPEGSAYTLATRLFRLAVGMGLRTIAFTKARVITELMHTWIVEAEPALAERISSYRAGFLPEERREIESRLFSGELLGVISTSALEMGIDVGGLDVCILVGYPGSQVATWQRGGRVGRTGEATIALVAQPDALDQYLVSHPRMFFDRGFESAVIDPQNHEIATAHLPCAAAEVPLRESEEWLSEPETRARTGELEEAGKLLRSEAGSEWFAAGRRPHREVSLRQIGASYVIALEGDPGARPHVVGSIGAARVYAECHEGAIYLHRGRQFLVKRLDPDEHMVWVRAVNSPYYTRSLSEKETKILSRDRTRPAGNFCVVQGRLEVTTTLTNFEKRRVRGQDLIGTEPLGDLPPSHFETVGIWLEFPDEIPHAIKAAGRHTMGGIHATEHAALSLFPLLALCDRLDVAGISTVRHPQTKRAAVFFYDGIPGGVGLAASLFDRVETLLEATLELISGCDCENGCPSCVHSPKCGSGNRPIDKAAAVQLLRLSLGLDPLPAIEAAVASVAKAPEEDATSREPLAEKPPRVVFFDIETQRSAQDVGGWHNAHLMRVALAVTWDSDLAAYETFREADVPSLLERLSAADLVVGFNIRSFDYKVLRGYTDRDLSEFATFDMLDAVHARLGFRLPLAHLAEETLGASKSADGLQSLQWWKEGRIAEIEEYCRRDVALLRELLAHAEQKGYLCFRTRNGDKVRLPAVWSVPELVERARAKRGDGTRGTPTTGAIVREKP